MPQPRVPGLSPTTYGKQSTAEGMGEREINERRERELEREGRGGRRDLGGEGGVEGGRKRERAGAERDGG